MKSVNETIADAIRSRGIILSRLEASQRKKIIKMLDKLLGQLALDINDVGLGGQYGTDYQKYRLKELFKAAQEAIRATYGDISSGMTRTLSGLMGTEAAWIVKTLNNSIGIELITLGLTQEQIIAAASDALILNAPSAEWWSRQSEKLMNNFKDTIRQGWLRGETNAQLLRRLTSSTDEEGFPIFDLRMGTRRGAEAVIRSSVQQIANDARTLVYRENANVVKGVMWVATLDQRTTIECFPGETPVIPVGSLQRVYKRFYSGEFVVVTTATGKEITGTPNHPILTPSGWLALDKVKPGQEVCYAVPDEKFSVFGEQNVSVPTSFSELFDSIYAHPFSEVSHERSSAGQFHGDGMGGDEEVCIVNPNRLLGNNVKAPFFGEHGKKGILRRSQEPGSLFGHGLFFKIFLRLFPTVPPLKVAVEFFENRVKPRLASFPGKLFQYLGRRNPFVKKANGKTGICGAQSVSPVSGGVFHDPRPNQEFGSCGGTHPEVFSNFASRFPGTVLRDNVVGVRREHRSCHVYNLQSSLGLYIASGFLVKNCASLDGLTWDLDGNPIGHDTTYSPPPRHWGCRSTTVPVLKSFRELGIVMDELPESTRASMDGQVPEGLSFDDWLRRKESEEPGFVADMFGKGKARLWLEGKISVRDMTDQTGRELTLKELIELFG